MKTQYLHDIIRGTLEVKHLYWRGRMDFRSRLRLWAERSLLLLPSRWVLYLFRLTRFSSRPLSPPVLRAAGKSLENRT